MRTFALLLAGIVLGVALTIVYVQISDGWYIYRTLSASDCRYPEDILGGGYQVVPFQPNPCHFRRHR